MATEIRVQDLATQRRAFRDGILADARAMVATMLGATRLPPRIVDLAFVLGTPGTPLLGTEQVFVRLGLNGPVEILSWSMAATVRAIPTPVSVAVDVQAGSSMATLNSVCGGQFPTLAGVQERNDQLATGWTLAIPDASWVLVRPAAVDGVVEVVGLTLRVAVGVQAALQVVADSSGNQLVDSSGNTVTWGS